MVAVGCSSHVQGRVSICSTGTVVNGPYFRISKEPITAALRWPAATKFAGLEPGGTKKPDPFVSGRIIIIIRIVAMPSWQLFFFCLSLSAPFFLCRCQTRALDENICRGCIAVPKPAER